MRRTGGTRHRARRTAAQWCKLVEQSERSGQTRSRFCAANGLALTTFDRWRRKLPAAPAAEARPEPLFVELTHPAPTQTSASSTGTGGGRSSLSSARVWCFGYVRSRMRRNVVQLAFSPA